MVEQTFTPTFLPSLEFEGILPKVDWGASFDE